MVWARSGFPTAGNPTEDELLARSDVYVADRDMVTGITKIKLTLELGPIDGQLCLVTDFVPMAKIENRQITALPGAPYASVQFTSERAQQSTGFITHKTDFTMLWAAFHERARGDR